MDGHLGSFHFLAVNVCVQVFVWTYVFGDLGYIPRHGMLGHTGILHLTFWQTARLFPKVTGLKSWCGEIMGPDGLSFYFMENFILYVFFFFHL